MIEHSSDICNAHPTILTFTRPEKNSTWLLMAGFLFCLFLAGCDQSPKNSTAESDTVISIAISTEPPILDSAKIADVTSGMLTHHISEGLLIYDANNKLAPGVAETWEMDEKGATFWLRKNARWSDGSTVTAHDFVFAWRRVVDPKTASGYAFIMLPIKNAEAITKGDLPVTSLGINALDDFTLKVDSERPYNLLSLSTFPPFMPIKESFFYQHEERYAADVDDLLFNGPFVVKKWIHGASLRLEKNLNYWNKDAVKLEAIDIPYLPLAVYSANRQQCIYSLPYSIQTVTPFEKLYWQLSFLCDGLVK